MKCQCGCGQEIPYKKHHKNYQPKYIKGHSNRGRKREPYNVEKAFWGRINKQSDDECWEWNGYLLPNGYGQMKVRQNNVYAHRYSFELHFHKIPHGLLVLHKCDNRKCVNPNHLFLGTHEDNMADMANKDRCNKKPGTTKITRYDAEKIRYYNKRGAHVVVLAELFNLEQSTIRNIIAYRIWNEPIVEAL